MPAVPAAYIILPATLIHSENVTSFVPSLAKNFSEKDPTPIGRSTQPDPLAESEILMETLRGLTLQQIAELIHVSDKITLLNAERNIAWHTLFIPDNTK